MNRSNPITVALMLGAALCAAAAAAWWASADRVAYYSGAGVEQASAEAHDPRDILWRPPVVLGPLQSEANEFEASVSLENDELFFVRETPEGDTDLFTARRSGMRWGTPRPLTGLNTLDDERSPALSPDGRWLYFASDRPGSVGGLDLWRARRSDTGWDEPEHLGPAVNTTHDEAYPAPTPDGQSLWYASNQPYVPEPAEGDAGSETGDLEPTAPREAVFDLYAAPFGGTASRVGALSSDADDLAPAWSPVGDFVYFASSREGGAGGFDLYRARRGEGDAPLTAQALGAEVNTPGDELDPAPGTEGFELIYTARAAEIGDDLMRTVSREVSLAQRTRYGDWSALMALLPWILALLALILLLAALRRLASRDALQRQLGALSLMAKCVLASMLLHALLLALLSVWMVEPEAGELVADSSGTHVSLASSRARSNIESQIRATSGEPAEITVEQIAPSHEPMPVEITPAAAAERVQRTQRETPERFQAAAPSESPSAAAVPSQTAADAPSVRAVTPAPTALPVQTPEAAAGETASESAASIDAALSRQIPAAPEGTLDLQVAPAQRLTPGRADAAVQDAPAAHRAPASSSQPAGAPASAALPSPDAAQAFEPAALALPDSSASADESAAETAPALAIGTPLPDAPAMAFEAPVTDTAAAAPSAARAAPSEERMVREIPRFDSPDAPVPTAPGQAVTLDIPAMALALPETDALTDPGLDAEPADEETEPELAWDAPELERAPEQAFTAEIPDHRVPRQQGELALPVPARSVPGAAPVPAASLDLPLASLTPSAANADLLRVPESVPVPDEPEPDSVSGVVLDALTSAPIPGARIRVDRAEDADLDAETDSDGAFLIRAHNVPAHFAMSADAEGYIPYASNVERDDLEEGVHLTILLWPENAMTVSLEDEPSVRHLGNDEFTGRVNSQFQRRAEGLSLTMPFTLTETQLPPNTGSATLMMLAKGVQLENPIFVNGRELRDHMPESRADGSFGEIRVPVPLRLLREGRNELTIQSIRRRDTDYDDFEFVNVRIEFLPAGAVID